MRRTTGSVYKRGKFYWARWRWRGQEVKKSTGCTNRKDAEDKLREWVEPYQLQDQADTLRTLAHKSQSVHEQAAKAIKVEAPLAYAWNWFAGTTSRRAPRSSTLRQYESQWTVFEKWIRKNHESIFTIEAITPAIARSFIGETRKTRSANTANKYLGLLRLIWEVLRKDERIEIENPWSKIVPIECVQQSRRELTIEELNNVCTKAEGELRPLFALGIYTGLRLGDVCTLRWSEVDFNRKIIRRVPNKSRKQKPVLIPIHPVLGAILDEIPRGSEFVLKQFSSDYLRHPTYATDRIQRHFTKCGITTNRKLDEFRRAVVDVGFHSLRHSFVSLSRNAGAPLAIVEAIVGHANPAMTRHYSHVGEDAAASAVALLPDVLGLPQKIDDKIVVSLPEKLSETIRILAKHNNADPANYALDLLKKAVKKSSSREHEYR